MNIEDYGVTFKLFSERQLTISQLYNIHYDIALDFNVLSANICINGEVIFSPSSYIYLYKDKYAKIIFNKRLYEKYIAKTRHQKSLIRHLGRPKIEKNRLWDIDAVEFAICM